MCGFYGTRVAFNVARIFKIPPNTGARMATRTILDEEALPQLTALHRFALKLCRDEQISKDLVQETMLKAYTYSRSYREGTNCRAWLFQICKNSYINETKRKKHQPVALDMNGGEATDGSAWNTGQYGGIDSVLHEGCSEHMNTEILCDEVAAAFETLPADYQTVVLLCDVEGYTYDEIAACMSAPVGTIRSRIHRGRKMLAHQLRDYACQYGYVTDSSQGSTYGVH
jgi:RNA polymerase sigma-70 factor, ECF subfamily